MAIRMRYAEETNMDALCFISVLIKPFIFVFKSSSSVPLSLRKEFYLRCLMYRGIKFVAAKSC